MRTHESRASWYRAEPRTPKEREVFTIMTVGADGATLYLPDELRRGMNGVLHLKDAAACAVLEELASSARRRLLEMEIDAMRLGDGARPAAAPVGAAGEADRPRPPG